MNIFNPVSFNADDVKAVANGTASRGQVWAIMTSQTCGEACWHAAEDICRCSCGGKNHGCLRNGDGKQPERTCLIGGLRYKLIGVGKHRDLTAEAREINRVAGWKWVDKPWQSESGQWHQYKYHWEYTDQGAPARLKTATDSQRNWAELAGWKAEREVYLLWKRTVAPNRPQHAVIDTETGLPLESQIPINP